MTKLSKTESDLKNMDIARRHNLEKIEDANHFLVNFDNVEKLIYEHPERDIFLGMTQKRIGHLLNKMLDKNLDPTDMKNVVWHSEMRGRLMEQVEHANVIQSFGSQRGFLERAKKALSQAIEGIAEKQKRKAGDK